MIKNNKIQLIYMIFMTNKNNYSILSLDEVRIITFYSRLGLNELLNRCV